MESIKLHVSTSALHTSIARSDRSVQSSLRIIYTSKYLLNWFLFAFKSYKHAKLQILRATNKSENQTTKTYLTYDRICLEIFALLLSRGSGAVSFHAYVSVSGSYENGINFVK